MTTNSDQALLAVRTGQLSTVKRLHGRGELDRNLRDAFGASCLHFAARSGNLQLVEFLMEVAGHSTISTAQNGALASHDAAAAGHQKCLEYLLRWGCPDDARDHNGATVLHLSARFGHLGLVRYLVEVRGMTIRGKDGKGVSILHYSAAKGDLDCLMYIITTAPDLANDRTESGATPAYFAVQNGHLACLQRLVAAAGANVHLRANDGMQPIHAAAQTGQLHCLIWLVQDQGVLVMERDNDGATPLHFAASRGHSRIVRWLLDNGAACDKDNLGGTPLHDAAEHGQLECAKILVEHGCDVNTEDKDFLVASDLAKQCNHFKVAKYLRSIEKRTGKAKGKGNSGHHMPSDHEAGVYIKQTISSPSNTSLSSVTSSIILSDHESSSSIGTIGEELVNRSGQYKVTESPDPDPDPAYIQIFEKLTGGTQVNSFSSSSTISLVDSNFLSQDAAAEENHVPKKTNEVCSQGTQTESSLQENLEANGTERADPKKLSPLPAVSPKKSLPRQRATEEMWYSSPRNPEQNLKSKDASPVKLSPEKKELRFSNTVMVEEVVRQEDGGTLNRFYQAKLHSPPLHKQFNTDLVPSPPALTNSPPPYLQTVTPNRPTKLAVPPPPTEASQLTTPPQQNGLHQLNKPNSVSSRLSFIASDVPTAPLPPPPPPTLPPPVLPAQSNGFLRRSLPASPSPHVSPSLLGPPSPSDLASIVLKPCKTSSRQSPSPLMVGGQGVGVTADLIAEIKAGAVLRPARKKQSRFLLTNGDPPSRGPSPIQDKGPKVYYAADFLDTVPMTDENGVELPDWRRRFLAKKEADKANRLATVEYKQQVQQKAEERKYRDMPPWKVELLKKREASQRL